MFPYYIIKYPYHPYRRRKYYLPARKRRSRRNLRGPRGPRGFPGPMGPEGPPGPACCTCTGNLVKNAGFESYTAILPEYWNSSEPSVITSNSAAHEVHSGEKSVVFDFTNNSTQTTLYQDVDIIPNCCFDFQFWLKKTSSLNSNSNLIAHVHFLNYSKEIMETPISISISPDSLSDMNFSCYRVITSPAPDEALEARIEFIVNGSEKAYCLDDIIFATYGQDHKL